MVFAALDVDQLTQTIGLQDSPRGTKYVILDHRGRLVARVPDAAPAERRLVERPLVNTVLRERQGTAEVKGPEGESTIYGFAPVGGNAMGRLFISAGRTSESVFADPNDDLRRFLLLAGLGLLVALALSYVMTALLLGRWSSAVVEAARRFGAGDLTARAPVPKGLGELTDVATALNAAAVDIEHRQEAQARLLAELVAAEEETRRRIAADIHDDTAQAVAAAGLRMDALAGTLEDPAQREAVLQARTALIEANRRLRRLLFELRPPALDEAGLGAALELFLTDSFAHDGFDWRVENRLEDEPAPEARAILYRVALEALTNVRKHANASHGRGAARAPRRGGDAARAGRRSRLRPTGAGRPGRARPHRPRLDARARRGGRRPLRHEQHAGKRHDRGVLDAGEERKEGVRPGVRPPDSARALTTLWV